MTGSRDMQRLRELAETLARTPSDNTERSRLWIGESDEGLFVDFHGNPAEDEYDELCEALSFPDVSSRLTTLLLRGPDSGSNGTVHWEVSGLVPPGTVYPRLRTVRIEQGMPGDHNSHILGEDYDEAGVLGRLLNVAPALETLASPSAPDASFFQTDLRPLASLSIRAGYDPQRFLENLALATNLPHLRHLEYGEGVGPGFEQVERAPFEAYLGVCQSSHSKLRSLWLYNPGISDEQCTLLKTQSSLAHVFVVRTTSRYW